MPQELNQQRRCRRQTQSQSQSQPLPQPQHRPASNSKIKSNTCNGHVTVESRNTFSRNPRRNKFMLVKIRGLGCKDNAMPASPPSIVRTAGEFRQENRGRRRPSSCNRRMNDPGNVVVDVPDVCCTPPGIGIASDFAPRNRNCTAAASSRIDHRKQAREARRNGKEPAARTRSRTNHRSAEETIQMLMAQQTLLHHSIINNHGLNRHDQWRLHIDDMSYEELLDLSEKIGYVGTGLQEEEISNCLRKFKHVTSDPTSRLMTDQKDWKCSICQEKCRRDEEIGRLECGHYHHVQCIKQWLSRKNQCPVCKSAAMPK